MLLKMRSAQAKMNAWADYYYEKIIYAMKTLPFLCAFLPTHPYHTNIL